MGLIPSRPSEEQIPTAELPKPEPPPYEEPELLTKQELEVTTADTKPLPPEMAKDQFTAEPKTDEQQMESKVTPTGKTASEIAERVSGPLLDLGDFEPARAPSEEDFVLDIDLNETPERAEEVRNVDEDFGMAQVVESKVDSIRAAVAAPVEPTVDPMAKTQEMIHPTIEPNPEGSRERAFTEPEIVAAEMLLTSRPAPVAGQVSLEQLSPEAIDAIARRAVEMLSEKAVQEIAWEVVPQLAELMIKRQLEEKNS